MDEFVTDDEIAAAKRQLRTVNGVVTFFADAWEEAFWTLIKAGFQGGHSFTKRVDSENEYRIGLQCNIFSVYFTPPDHLHFTVHADDTLKTVTVAWTTKSEDPEPPAQQRAETRTIEVDKVSFDCARRQVADFVEWTSKQR